MQMNVLSMAPITASAFGSNFLYNSLHGALTGRDTMEGHERLVTGFLAGATSAVAANPTELVVIRQQQTGVPLFGAVRQLVKRHGFHAFGVGIYATMAREGIYAACWMEVQTPSLAMHTSHVCWDQLALCRRLSV